MKNTVGVACFIRASKENKPFALLQVRGKRATNGTPESYPGVAQVTVFGGIKSGEGILQALRRETQEEVKAIIERNKLPPLPGKWSSILENLSRWPTSLRLLRREVTVSLRGILQRNIFLGTEIIDPFLLEYLRTNAPDPELLPLAHPHFRLVSQEELLTRSKIITEAENTKDLRQKGVFGGDLVLFADSFKALKEAFKYL